jgi:hypothetical protein
VGSVVDKVAVGQVFLQTLHISTINYKSTNFPHSSSIIWRWAQGPKGYSSTETHAHPPKGKTQLLHIALNNIVLKA